MSLVVKLLKLLMHSRIGGVLLTTELTVAVGWIHHLPGVTVDPGWKQKKRICFLNVRTCRCGASWSPLLVALTDTRRLPA